MRNAERSVISLHVLPFVAWIGGSVPAAAQGYNGLCFPGDGCTGPVPIAGNAFYTCEESCVMEEPMQVRGMDATLFDVTCRGDSGTYSFRMMIARIMTDAGLSSYAITNNGVTPLVRCD